MKIAQKEISPSPGSYRKKSYKKSKLKYKDNKKYNSGQGAGEPLSLGSRAQNTQNAIQYFEKNLSDSSQYLNKRNYILQFRPIRQAQSHRGEHR